MVIINSNCCIGNKRLAIQARQAHRSCTRSRTDLPIAMLQVWHFVVSIYIIMTQHNMIRLFSCYWLVVYITDHLNMSRWSTSLYLPLNIHVGVSAISRGQVRENVAGKFATSCATSCRDALMWTGRNYWVMRLAQHAWHHRNTAQENQQNTVSH